MPALDRAVVDVERLTRRRRRKSARQRSNHNREFFSCGRCQQKGVVVRVEAYSAGRPFLESV